MTIYIGILAALLGAILYFVAANAKVAELARLTYACGLLAFMLAVAGKSVELLK